MFFMFSFSLILKVNMLYSYAPVTQPYICQRTPTYGDTSDKLDARFIYVKNTSRTFFISYTVRIRPVGKLPNRRIMRRKIRSCDSSIRIVSVHVRYLLIFTFVHLNLIVAFK